MGLDRDAIAAAAVRVADAGGAEALTMAAVARELGPYTPMALYRHVGSKLGLVDLMLDAATAEMTLPAEPTGDWRADLTTVATETWAAVRRHGWYAELVHTRPPLGPHLMRRLELMLGALTGAGLSVRDAMGYASLVDRHVVGLGVQEAEDRRMRRRADLEEWDDFVAAMAPVRERAAAGGYPLLAEWLDRPGGPSTDEQFDLGLGWLLDGIASRLPRPRVRRGGRRR